MSERVPDGALAIITQTHEGIDGINYAGQIFRVDGHYDVEEVDGEILPASYAGSSLDGFESFEPHAEFVEFYKTAEEAKSITIPSREAIAFAVSAAVMGIWNEHGFSVHTGEKPDPDSLEFGARTDEGLEFYFTLKVTGVSGSDW